jgi:DNA polymerase/3'-5' exonuclease PolX
MKLDQAREIAEEFISSIDTYCHRCEVAGSIRRKKPDDIKDIEIVIIPRPEKLSELKSKLEEYTIIKGKFPGKYIQLKHRTKTIDLFITDKAHWGCIFLIRTGSSEFNMALMKYAYEACGKCFKDGRLWVMHIHTGNPSDFHRPIYTPEEKDVFDALGLKFVEPEERADGRAIKQRG